MEAEYVVLYHAGLQAAWIGSFMDQLGFPLDRPLEVLCDNEAAISVANGGDLPFKKAKHMNVKYHKIKDYADFNELAVTKVTSEDNLADVLTKVLPKARFEALSDRFF